MLNKRTLDGHVETLLLSILLQRPSYGYRIVRELNKLAPDLLKMGEGTVYPVLHRMEDRGLIRGKWEKDDGRARKYYYVSQKGRRQFAKSQEQWAGLQQVMADVFDASSSPAPKIKGATQ